MSHDDKTAILMMSDPMVLKGLQLLLEDMGFRVIASRHAGELIALASKQTRRPELIILSFEIENGKAGDALIHQLRDIFQQVIPVIQLSPENGTSPTRHVEENVLVLSDQIKPKELRNKINAFVGKELA
jgi:DNA-binding response OmpR family regulator